MAVHNDKVELLKESLVELLETAKMTVRYRKTQRSLWGKNATNGILGFPSVILLFSIIDCIGSVFCNDNNFKMKLDGKERVIKKTSQHFFILNSRYFKLDLAEEDIKNIYNNIRSTIVHNSLMPEGYHLQIGKGEKVPFMIGVGETGKKIYVVNVIELLKVTNNALVIFFKDIKDKTVDLKESDIFKHIDLRDKQSPIYLDMSNKAQMFIKVKTWIKH